MASKFDKLFGDVDAQQSEMFDVTVFVYDRNDDCILVGIVNDSPLDLSECVEIVKQNTLEMAKLRSDDEWHQFPGLYINTVIYWGGPFVNVMPKTPNPNERDNIVLSASFVSCYDVLFAYTPA